MWIVRKLNQSPHSWDSIIEIFLKHSAFLAAFKMQRGHSCSSLRAEVGDLGLMGSVRFLWEHFESDLIHTDSRTLPVRMEQWICTASNVYTK